MRLHEPFGSDDWRAYLARLPESAPSDTLWLRLQAAHAAKGSPPRGLHAVGMAAGVALLALGFGAVLFAALQDRSAVVQQTPPQEQDASAEAPRRHAGLLQLDGELEQAYARGADEAEIANLWATRERVRQTLDTSSPALVARL